MSTIKTNQLAHTANGASVYTLPQTDGSAGQVLKTDGSGNLSWTSLPSAGITMADTFRLTTQYDIPHNSTTVIPTTNWERPDTANDGFNQLGTGMSIDTSNHAAGLYTFPSTGFYLISYGGYCYNGSNDPYEVFVRMEFTENGSNFGVQGRVYLSGERYNYNGGYGQMIVDVTNASTQKFRLRVYSAVSSSKLHGDTNGNRNYLNFLRIGDT
tara:strand:- start:1417 stop:2052 length:636 start_codon:yes stop_codon:yes gene_type:complete